jgi:hypothetical protein
MSWFAAGIVVDGDTSELEKVLEANDQHFNDEMREQQQFAMNVVAEAFEALVVEGAYSVSLTGHSNSEQENDRKSLSMTFSPTTLPATTDEVV